LRLKAGGAEHSLPSSKDNPGLLTEPIEGTFVESSLRLWVNAGIAVALLATIFMGFLSWRSVGKAAEDADWVAHTQAVKTALETALRHVIDVETGARAFDATGNESFLKPYFDGEQAIGQDMEMLRHLTADNPAQQRRLGLLESQTKSKLELSANMVAAQRRSGTLSSLVTFLESKKRMDAIRATVLEMQAEETGLLDQRAGTAQAERRRTKLITCAGTLVGLV